ncbi:MAG: hypothetical protein HS116_02295 [Planctomycetes bacterium]|nr:hypothetical protein [Planctomycetota bacterium]
MPPQVAASAEEFDPDPEVQASINRLLDACERIEGEKWTDGTACLICGAYMRALIETPPGSKRTVCTDCHEALRLDAEAKLERERERARRFTNCGACLVRTARTRTLPCPRCHRALCVECATKQHRCR